MEGYGNEFLVCSCGLSLKDHIMNEKIRECMETLRD